MKKQEYNKVQWLTVDEEYAGQRIDNFLIRVLKGVPKSMIYRILRRGEVRAMRSVFLRSGWQPSPIQVRSQPVNY
jgi:23S rRNA-/tRNA-specific pseudouridylate synthase